MQPELLEWADRKELPAGGEATRQCYLFTAPQEHLFDSGLPKSVTRNVMRDFYTRCSKTLHGTAIDSERRSLDLSHATDAWRQAWAGHAASPTATSVAQLHEALEERLRRAAKMPSVQDLVVVNLVLVMTERRPSSAHSGSGSRIIIGLLKLRLDINMALQIDKRIRTRTETFELPIGTDGRSEVVEAHPSLTNLPAILRKSQPGAFILSESGLVVDPHWRADLKAPYMTAGAAPYYTKDGETLRSPAGNLLCGKEEEDPDVIYRRLELFYRASVDFANSLLVNHGFARCKMRLQQIVRGYDLLQKRKDFDYTTLRGSYCFFCRPGCRSHTNAIRWC
jgi:hypothetical protein